MENKIADKSLAENPINVETMVRSLRECAKLDPDILQDLEMIFKSDKMELCGQHGKMQKTFVSADAYKPSFSKPRKHLPA